MITLRSFPPQRGSVLIVALVFSAIMAVSLTSYLKLALNAGNLANRSFYMDGAQNMVDLGLEHALWSLNNNNWSSAAHFAARGSGFTNQYQGTMPTVTLSGGVTGEVKVWVNNNGSNPHAVAEATITLADGTSFSKMAETYMKRSSLFTNGLVAKDRLVFGGNVKVDSWNSDPGNTGAATTAYSGTTDNDGGRIASLLVDVESIDVGNADVYGYAAIGGSSTADIDVGSTGRIGPYGIGNGQIDSTRVTYDFTTSFPDVEQTPAASITPSYTIDPITAGIILPDPDDSGVVDPTDGKTYYHYYTPNINLSGLGAVITITAGKNVVLNVTDTTGTTVTTGGNAGITIPPTASLKMYASGNVAIGGNGVLNGTTATVGDTRSFQFYGTATADAPQTISIKGNSHLTGVLYAPNGAVTVTGTAAVYGAVVAKSVNMGGTGDFHYDESLANLATSNLWKISKWREITLANERADYADELNF